jgi:tetratricopeptide (TPR) repeat protein
MVVRCDPHRRRAAVRLRALVVGLVFVALGGLVAYPIGRQLWAWQHYREAQRAVGRRDFQAARQHLARCLEVWASSAETHFEAARSARRAEDYTDADDELHEARRLGWAPEAIALEQALTRVQQGEFGRDEIPLLDYITAHENASDPEVPIILEALSKGYLRTYRLWEAFQTLTQWLEREPDNARAHLWRAWVAGRMHDFHGAEEDYGRAVECDPELEEARIRLAESVLRNGKVSLALEHLSYLQQRLPENLLVDYDLAVCRHELGQDAEARTLLDQMFARHLADVEDLARRPLWERQGPEPGWWREVVRLAPYDQRHPHYVITLFVLALNQRALLAETVEGREPYLRRALALDPHNDQANFQLYVCLHRLGRPDAEQYRQRWEQIKKDQDVLAQTTRQITLTPHDPELRCRAGEIFLRHGQLQEAARWLESALREDRHYSRAHQLLAEYCDRVRDYDGASRHRQLALQARSPVP